MGGRKDRSRREAHVEGDAGEQQPPRPQPTPTAAEELPGVQFHLYADKKRAHVTPRDAASLCLWCMLPVEHPLCVDAPRWCFVRHKRDIRHCCVVSIDGLSFEMVSSSAAASSPDADSLSSRDGVPLQQRPDSWLRVLRQLGADVQFCPLWLNSSNGRVDVEYFLRHDRRHRSSGSSGPPSVVAPAPSVETSANEDQQPPPPPAETPKPVSVLARVIELARMSKLGDQPDALHARILSEQQAHRTARDVAGEQRLLTEDVQEAWSVPTQRLEELCMSPQDLVSHGFVTAPNDEFLPLLAPEDITDRHPEVAVALDCEMVLAAGNRSMLARVSVVRVPTGEVLYDAIVQPTEPVVDYVTRYSGMTHEILSSPAAVPFCEAQATVRHIVSDDTFIVGHSLENDLQALRLLPSAKPRIIDTTFLFPHTNGLPNKNALRYLVHGFLNGRTIQAGHAGHDSIEDAAVCIDLVALKLRYGAGFGLPPRINICSLLATPLPATAAASNTPTWQPPDIHIVDRAEVLRRVASRGVSAVFSKGDSDAVRKSCGILTHAQTTNPRGVMLYVTLRETTTTTSDGALATPPAVHQEETAVHQEETAVHQEETAVHQEETTCEVEAQNVTKCSVPPHQQQHEQDGDDDGGKVRLCDTLDAHLARLINAAPLNTLFVVMAAMNPTGEGAPNRHAAAHGTLWAFVKHQELVRSHPLLSEDPASYRADAGGAHVTATEGCAHA